jgi:hypothetical protein
MLLNNFSLGTKLHIPNQDTDIFVQTKIMNQLQVLAQCPTLPSK